MVEKNDISNIPEMPKEALSDHIDIPPMPQEQKQTETYPNLNEEKILEQHNMSTENVNIANDQNLKHEDVQLPPMPQETNLNNNINPENLQYASDDEAYETLVGHARTRFEDDNQNTQPKENKFSEWLQKIQYQIIKNKIKFAKITGGIFASILIVYLFFSFTFSYFVEFAFSRVIKNLNLPIASYNVVFADSTNLILVDVIDKNGSKIAKEVIIIYNIWDFIFNSKVQEININLLNLQAEVKNNTIISPFFSSIKNNSEIAKEDGRPKIFIDKVLINNGKFSIFGEENGTAEFSLSGRIANVFTFSAPLKIKTDNFSGTIDTKGSGWGKNYSLTGTYKNSDFIFQGIPSKTSGDFNVSLENNQLSKWSFKSNYKLGQYNINFDTDGTFNRGTLNASLNINTEEVKNELLESNPKPIVGREILRTRRQNPNNEANPSQLFQQETENISIALPIGDLNIKISQAKLDGNLTKFQGNLPINIISKGITFGNFKSGKIELNADGILNCQNNACSYTLNDPLNMNIDGIVLPAFNSRFDTKDTISVNIASDNKPILNISKDKIAFNMTLLNPFLRGAFAGVTTSNLFAMQAEKGILSGSLDYNGNYQAILLLDRLAYNDSIFSVNGAKFETAFSTNQNPSLKLYASLVEMKGDKVLFPPSNVFLEAVPDEYAHRFKLIIQTPVYASSFFMAGIYDYLKDRGVAKFAIPEIIFSADKTPDQVFPFIGANLKDVSGTFSAKGNISWGPSGVSGPAMFSFSDFSARKGDIKVSGLNGQFIVTNFNPLTTMPNQLLTADNLNLIFPFKNVRMKFSLNGQNDFIVDDFSANIASGRATNIDRITIPFALNASPSMLVIKDVDMAELAKMLNMDIVMSGKLNARLPIALRPNDIQIFIGDIQTVGGGYIKYQPNKTRNLQQNSEENLIFSDLNFSSIKGEIDGSLNKDMTLKLKVQGKNPAYNGNQQFHKDIQIKGNLNSLFKTY